MESDVYNEFPFIFPVGKASSERYYDDIVGLLVNGTFRKVYH